MLLRAKHSIVRGCTYARIRRAHSEAIPAAPLSSSVYEAWPLIRQRYLAPPKSGTVPPAIVSEFYGICTRDPSPLAPFYFSQLVTVNRVGARHFAANCERLVKLLLARDCIESCIAFIREIELANKGNLELSYDTLEALLIAAKWHGDADIAHQAMQILVQQHQHVYARTWGLFMQLCLDTANYNTTKWCHKHALVPGFLVLDDASYLRLAQIAAQNGDLRLCEWSSLRMRRRQRALGSSSSSRDSLNLYICLIEAAARSDETQITTVCRYVARLGALASEVSVGDLPQAVAALTEPQDLAVVLEIFDEIADSEAHDAVKTLLFNLLLSALLAVSSSGGQLAPARAFAVEARERAIKFNEDSTLLLIELARRGGSDARTLEAIAMQCPSEKVLGRVRSIAKYCI